MNGKKGSGNLLHFGEFTLVAFLDLHQFVMMAPFDDFPLMSVSYTHLDVYKRQ